MNLGLISVVSVLTDDRFSSSGNDPTHNPVGGQSSTIIMPRTSEHAAAVATPGSRLTREQQRWSAESRILTETAESTSKAMKFSHRSLWCIFFLVMPVVIPILIFIKDSDVTRRIFLGFFIIVLIILLACFSLVIFQTKTRQMIISRRNSDDDQGGHYRSLRPQVNGMRSAYRGGQAVEGSPRGSVHFHHHHHHQTSSARNSSSSTPMHPHHHSSGGAPSRSNLANPAVFSLRVVPAQDLTTIQFLHHHPLNMTNAVSPSPATLCSTASVPPLTLAPPPPDNPPPYHVAINLPAPQVLPLSSSATSNSLETPPPPYEHAIR